MKRSNNTVLKGEKLMAQMEFFQTDEGRKLMEDFAKTMADFFEKTPWATKMLAKHGWYIPFNSIPGEVFAYAKALENGEIESVNKTLEALFEKDLDNIIWRAYMDFPERESILKEAKQAHDSQMYFASTILFLSIADGIFNGALFEKKKFAKTLNKKGLRNDLFTQFLTEEIAVTKFADVSKKGNSSFSRHGIMHGQDINYGTKLNSLKAASLLDYVSVFVLIR